MRVLQPIYDGGGGMPPQFAVLRRLVERGHEVKVVGHGGLREPAEARGAEFVPWRDAFPEHDSRRPETDVVADWSARTSIGAAARFRDIGLRAIVRDTARETRALLERWPADVALCDFCLAGPVIAAESMNIPVFVIVHCPYPGPVPGVPPVGSGLRPGHNALTRARDRLATAATLRFYTPLLETVNEVRAEFGLAEYPDFYAMTGDSEGTFVVTAPEFDFCSRGQLPASVRYVGPAFEPPDQTWESPWPEENSDPLVVVSFSTTYMNQRELAKRVLEALAPLRVRALVTTGPALDLSGVRLPANARVASFVPHAAVFPHASLVVTHAGLGTTQAALAAGVPVVCIPDGRDQPDNAARVVEAEAGLRVRKSSSATRIRKAVVAALADPALKAGAARMAQALNREDGISAIVEALERRVGATSAAEPSPAVAS